MSFPKHEFAQNKVAAEDRRSQHRSTSIYKPVLIEIGGFLGFCLVRNLSAAGMMGSVYADFSPDQDALVRFSTDFGVAGTVVWSSDQKIGIRFKENIDVQFVIQSLSAPSVDGRRSRGPRLQMQTSGEVTIDDRTLPITVLDVSQSGLKAIAQFLRPGEELTVQVEGLSPRRAVVRWVQNGTAGLNFMRPLKFDELADWAIAIQSRHGL